MSRAWIIVVSVIGIGLALFGGYRFLSSRQQANRAASPVETNASFDECVASQTKPGQDPSVANDACIRLQDSAASATTNQTSPDSATRSRTSSDTPPLTIKSLPLALAPYDAATGKAGDIAFTKEKLSTGLIFMDYGYVISGEISANGEKSNPQPTFLAPLGTQVRSIVDGVVVAIPELYSGDFSIQVADSTTSSWIYETEHVLNPTVAVGERVTAGQAIAEVSNHDSQHNGGLGLVEMGILQAGNPPQHVCPFTYLDSSIAGSTNQALTQLYSDWESYRGDTSLYNESALTTPGCLTLDAIKG